MASGVAVFCLGDCLSRWTQLAHPFVATFHRVDSVEEGHCDEIQGREVVVGGVYGHLAGKLAQDHLGTGVHHLDCVVLRSRLVEQVPARSLPGQHAAVLLQGPNLAEEVLEVHLADHAVVDVEDVHCRGPLVYHFALHAAVHSLDRSAPFLPDLHV